ncbi:MAG TPA: SDR family oxidoreductase [Dongiaceae bacterium]|jgi:NAD(P)-dependent dehydrogenase (short-subunit alcohol dehydrogenase family)|nr:SDR family oxidoreductase [Dongiaceae bacterium]
MDLTNFGKFPSLRGTTIFVTGGGSGIGAAIVESFVDQGARVAFVDIDEATSGALCDSLRAQYGIAPHFTRCDITDIAALQAAIDKTSRDLGDIGVLVNNAANDMRHDWSKVTPDYWDERMNINLRPVFFAIQSVVPQMKRLGGGSIINFGSISWKVRMGGAAAYTTAKAAIHGLTRGMARDLGQDSIRVNTVLPGWIMTERQKKLWLDEAGEKLLDQEQCLKGRIEPIDVARMVLFLASDDARMCSAQEFTIDGGWA